MAYFPEVICKRIILFDGLARAGKMLVGPLVGEMTRVEWPQSELVIDNIPYLWRISGGNTEDFAAMLRLTVNGFVYQRAIGRHLNTRETDVFSIYRSFQSERIDGRRAGGEGNEALDSWLMEKPYMSFISHHQLPLSDLWFSALPDLRFVIPIRHPVDVCASWMKRNWGERYGRDRLAFSLTTAHAGAPIPWFAEEFADDYLAASPMDRIIMCVCSLMTLYDAAYDRLSLQQRNQVRFVGFEELATRPDEVGRDVAGWLGTSLPPKWDVTKKRERVPRALEIEDRRKKFADVCALATSARIEELAEASQKYEAAWGLEPL